MVAENTDRESLKKFLETVIVCPACHGKLEKKENSLQCTVPGCHRIYPIKEGIPVLLIDESTQPES